MTDIEQELHALGERAREQQLLTPTLTSQTLRRIRLRRLGATVTGAIILAAVVFGGAQAARTFGNDHLDLRPAGDGEPPGPALMSLHADFQGKRAGLAMDANTGIVCYFIESLKGHESFTRVDIVEGADEKSSVLLLHPAASEIPLPARDGKCVHDVDEDAIRSITGSPERYFLLIESPVDGQLIAGLTTGAGGLEPPSSPATRALNREDVAAAREIAHSMLTAATDPNHWDYGNKIHYGNLILGHIALRQGNIEEAKSYLLKAGRTPGSPQLNSFGPNMSLARDLLLMDEPEVVLNYLRLCEAFWDLGIEDLQTWNADVSAGRMPDFGANLTYGGLNPEPIRPPSESATGHEQAPPCGLPQLRPTYLPWAENDEGIPPTSTDMGERVFSADWAGLSPNEIVGMSVFHDPDFGGHTSDVPAPSLPDGTTGWLLEHDVLDPGATPEPPGTTVFEWSINWPLRSAGRCKSLQLVLHVDGLSKGQEGAELLKVAESLIEP